MPFQLTLTLEYKADTEWRWVLADATGTFLTDQEVRLYPDDPLYQGFEDLPRYIARYENVRPAEEVLADLGEWMGEKVFGAVGQTLLRYEQSPACVVRVRVPPSAQNLLFRPFELAHLGGKPLAARGFRLIYTLAREDVDSPGDAVTKDTSSSESLRMLGVFSLPRGVAPLNLRRERHQLRRLVSNFAQRGGGAIELRLLQYGTTRELLKEVLQESRGWDVLHFSGHGVEGELILERPDGSADRVDAKELAGLLRPAASRLKLLTLSVSCSGAADLRAARSLIGLDNPHPPLINPGEENSVLPSIGQHLAEELDCAVLAMRYSVPDDFAAELTLNLYDRLLEKKQPLPHALQIALSDALAPGRYPFRPTFSLVSPLLFGTRAADLRLRVPRRTSSFVPAQTGLLHFPPMPERFVGRLIPMLKARQALAPESGKTGVLFYGMAGAGKTSCALELAYDYDPKNLGRFAGCVWYKAPEEGGDIADALTRFALSMEEQLPGLELVGLMDNPEDFPGKVLPRLRSLLENNSVLLVIDNLEGVLTPQGDWRDPRWGRLLDAMLNHDGLSRLVLTSRRLPVSLAGHPRLQTEAIHTLGLQESVLLAREMPNLKELFIDDADLEKLQRILRAAQGHPKLLEHADEMASDPAALEAQLARYETAGETTDPIRLSFFETGRSGLGADELIKELHVWTEGVAWNLQSTARLLAQFLARLEEDDRASYVVKANWENFLRRLTGEGAEDQQPAPEPAISQARAALGEPERGLESALAQLAQAGLIEVETIAPQGEQPSDTHQQFRLHPDVAEALLRSAPQAVAVAADSVASDYFVEMFRYGVRKETQGGGRFVLEGARRAAPYLLRAQRWEELTWLLEALIRRDDRPQTLAFVIPLLRTSAERMAGTESEWRVEGTLADALSRIGRHSEAEAILHEAIWRSRKQRDPRPATIISRHLFNLLVSTGRYEEALRTTEEAAVSAREARLGPWTVLSHESDRLKVLDLLGRYPEVLEAVQRHLSLMEDLPEEGWDKEIVTPWIVRESLLVVGVRAASNLRQWETVLSLNTQLMLSRKQRGMPEFEIARARFNNYRPLLRLARYAEALSLLVDCRAVFEQEDAVNEIGWTYNAQAALENIEGHPASAVRLAQTGLRYTYAVGDPDFCARGHHELAAYFERVEGHGSAHALAHRLAAAVIRLQINSGALTATLRSLARGEMRPDRPSFEEICDLVEQVEGVRFRELFARLPSRVPGGEEAIQTVWEIATTEAGKLSSEQGEQLQVILREFEPLLHAVAAGARGDKQSRGAVEEFLPELEVDGWKIGGPLRRILDGESDASTLSDGLDEAQSALVRRALVLASGAHAPDTEAAPAKGKADASRKTPPDEGDIPSRARLFFKNAGFKTRDLTPDTFFCVADKSVWENRFPRPIHTKAIYTVCYLGRRLTRDAVSEIYEESEKTVLHVPDIIFVIFDQVPTEEGWIEIQALRRDVQIVPVDYAVIRQGLAQQGEAKELEKLLRRFLGKASNLYNERHPIADSLSFFGRESRASELLAMLKTRRPVALFGLRKMGKSSLLKYLQNTADFPVAYIDLQFSSEPKEVFRKILEDWQAALILRLPSLGWTNQYDPSDPFTSFAANARDLITRLEAAQPGMLLGIFLDEIEVIAPSISEVLSKKYEEDSSARYLSFARTLRGLVQETDGVALMVVGVDPLVNRFTRLAGKQNPFYQFFSEEYLGPLSHDDCVQMIRNIGSQMSLRYSDEAAACVAELSGGHPFLARQLCSLIVESLKSDLRRKSDVEGLGSVGDITMEDLRGAAEEFVSTPQTATLLNEEGLWGEVTDANIWLPHLVKETRSLLVELAGAGAEPEVKLLEAAADSDARRQSLHELKQRAVVGDFQQLLRIRIKLFSDWIKRYQIVPRS